jgi:Fe-S cluster assembly protein SufB
MEGLEKIEELRRTGSDYNYGFQTKTKYKYDFGAGITEELIREISKIKKEPEWMLKLRLASYKDFMSRPTPTWGYPDLDKDMDFDKFYYYSPPDSPFTTDWDKVPKEIKDTYEKLGVPDAERKILAGSLSVFDSDSVVAKLRKEWQDKGVIFTDVDTALKEHPDLVRKYFMKSVPFSDNKFSALHGAVWSGGPFIYIPPGVKIDTPLQTYFRMNRKEGGQFEHTLIIADEGSEVTYVEGCSAPVFEPDIKALHAAIVEVFVQKGSKVKFISAENWSRNVYNLNTKRAIVGANANMEWVEATLGSKVTMLYPASYLVGDGASSSNLTVSFAQPGTWKDSGSKVIMSAKNQSAKIISKSISLGGGSAVYRGLLRINKNAANAKAYTQCDSLLLDEGAVTSTFPHNEVLNSSAKIYHEATVGRVSREKLFYLMSRGLTEAQARSLIVLGFMDSVLKEIPLEFAVEINRLIDTEISKLPGATG